MKKVAVVLGSDSDIPVMKGCVRTLEAFGVPYTVHIMSAHRTPDAAHEFSAKARENGYGVMIAAAGKAAHLAGVLAASTTVPVIGVPVKSSTLDGLDALLSTVQMPKGIPVATVAIDGADNAALLAVQMLSLAEESLAEKLQAHKKSMAAEVLRKNEQAAAKFAEQA
ncbi:MAG: 5-(carboxyamino)imidazole ribonucleotide mutase [Clostridia bacterium]|nr:5-(carboxyamino)imidazole ribonucleotide mutase [Clostridia bacterium]